MGVALVPRAALSAAVLAALRAVASIANAIFCKFQILFSLAAKRSCFFSLSAKQPYLFSLAAKRSYLFSLSAKRSYFFSLSAKRSCSFSLLPFLHQKLPADGIVVLHHIHNICKKRCTTHHFYFIGFSF